MVRIQGVRRAGLIACVGLVLTAAAEAPFRTPTPSRPAAYASALRQKSLVVSPRKPVGYAAHVLAQGDPNRYVRLIADGGATSFRDDLEWAFIEPANGQFDWTGPDEIVGEAAAHHLHALMIVDTTPAWASGASTTADDWEWLPPIDPAMYGVFAAQVAARYGTSGSFWRQNPNLPRYLPAGIELWNEENLSGFWGRKTPSPTVYAAMVEAAYGRIKKADPAMTVLLGGLAPAGGYNDVTCNGSTHNGHNSTAWNGINYLQALYRNGLHGHFNAAAWHPYNYWRGATATQMLRYNICSGWSQMTATPVSVRSVMTAHGDGAKLLWATEVGVPTCTATGTYICVSAAQQADLASQENILWKRWRWAGGYYWYDIRDDGRSNSNESHFGTVRASNTLKPSYAALKRAWQ